MQAQPEAQPLGPSERAHPLASLKIRDFRLLWTGALLSFIGSWVQTVAQGWLVFELTHDEAKLAMVAFCGMIPVSIFGPFAGALADTLNRRTGLILTQLVFGLNAFVLALLNHMGWIRYEHILIIALINGCVSTIEMPMRQSLVSTVVPKDLLASAVPIQATTFNLARVIGPAIGGQMLAWFGPQSCYLFNGVSYIALIAAVLAIRADLRAQAREVQPIKDLLTEGIIYTFRDRRLKMLFLMESTVSIFGLAYLPLVPALAKEVLKLDKQGLGFIYTCIGIGAMTGLGTLIWLSGKPWKGHVIRIAMTCMGAGLIALSFVRQPLLAFPLFAILGASSIMQFNSTNALFQAIAPEQIKGRVIAMHIWALSGSAPIALPLFGWISREMGVPMATLAGGSVVFLGAMWTWLRPGAMNDLG